MDKKKIIIIIGICVFICIVLGIFIYQFGNKKDDNITNIVIDEESKTKDIKNVEYGEIIIYKEDGTKAKLSDSKDRPVMLLFWNEENEDSVAVLEKVEDLYKNYNDKIDFYMINTSKNVSKKIKDKISLDIYYDLDGTAQEEYNVQELPSMIYINENNEVFNAKSGFTTTDALDANLEILYNNDIIINE